MRNLRIVGVVLLLVGLASPVGAQIQPFNYWVSPSDCTSVVSGNSTGTNGQTVAGASNTPVVQAQTSASGTNTHTYICNIAPPVNLLNRTGNRITIYDAVVFYGTQTTALDTQVASGSAGTLNSSIVFSFINYPTPGANETSSNVTPVRADSGTLAMTPVVGSFNVSTTVAGRFFSQTFTPASPISWNTDLSQLLLTITLKLQASSATVTNSPGVLIHVRTN